ncbi:ABC multidrug transporter [Xylariaceae sp. FL0804]|nr:ABC multidrug transporter [Xylariaceae sp. FL0804]
MSTSGCNDQSIGPSVRGCRGGFDFTIEFEQLVFSLVPSALFILVSLWRVWVLARRPVIVDAPLFQLAKLTTVISYTSVELCLLVLAAIRSSSATDLAVAAAAARLAAGLCMVAVSFLDHGRSPRPSALLSAYLALTALPDAAQVRTSWLVAAAEAATPTATARRSDDLAVAHGSLLGAALGLKAVALVLEAQRKDRWLTHWADADADAGDHGDHGDHSPEETAGLFDLGVYFWLNGLFRAGYGRVLRVADLYPLDRRMAAEHLHARFARRWGAAGPAGSRYGLLGVLARTLATDLLLPVPARLAQIGFKLCQPLFINRLLQTLSEPVGPESASIGYGFIGASALIYLGIAISTAFYWYYHNRMLYMARGCLVAAIYTKSTEARAVAGDENGALTLMSTDMERIRFGFSGMHEIWANLVEVVIASWLLYLHLGAAFAAPIVIVVACVIGTLIPMKMASRAQERWMEGVQRRVGLTSSVIANMKNLKMSGMASPIAKSIQQLRLDELAAGSGFRKIGVTAAAFGFLPMLISPFLTFAIAGRSLSTASLFTSLSYLYLMTQPFSQVLQTLPVLVAGLTCLERIQKYLESERRVDSRTAPGPEMASEKSASLHAGVPVPLHDQPSVFSIKYGSVGWSEEKVVLKDVNLEVKRSSLTMVVGPVASGKTSLCRALLSEIPHSRGRIALDTAFSRVGFCDQTPFLFNGSIRDNIVGFSHFDRQRYTSVTDATMLGIDLETLPNADETVVGSNGIILSGGQKQRVSLARALYLETDLYIFDDIFSGLDDQVFRRVLGPDGILRQRKATTVLCTHSVHHLPAADHVIALGADGYIVEQGTYSDLLAQESYVHSLDVKGLSASASPDDEAQGHKVSSMSAQPDLLTKTTALASTRESEDKSRQVGGFSTYKVYFKSVGWAVSVLALLSSVGYGFFFCFPTIWLSFWATDAAKANPAHSSAYYVGVYAGLQMSSVFSFLALCILVFIYVYKRAGASLHHGALQTLISAPLRFFTTTDQGAVTNLFSQDLNLIDTELSLAVLNLMPCVCLAVGQAAIIASSSPYLAISYPFLVAALFLIQKFYLRTSRQLRLLELEAKSPLYTHFLDTVKGIVTLRAFGFIGDDLAKNMRLLDTSQRPAYLLVMIQQWLSLVLNLLVAILAVILTALVTQLRTSSGFTGASLVTLMTFGQELTDIVKFYTLLETSLGAVARLDAFNRTVRPEDQPREDVVPPDEWPQRGEISLSGVSASYSDTDAEANLALKDIRLTIRGGEKIAVCGRTGSGKSSLIALLMKMLEPTTPAAAHLTDSSSSSSPSLLSSPAAAAAPILIDDLPLHRLRRAALRRRLLCVPQDAVFLPDGASVRANLLDPYYGDGDSDGGAATTTTDDDDARRVLEVVGLLPQLELAGGVDAILTPATLSQGQRQLFSLARAVLRRRVRARARARCGAVVQQGGAAGERDGGVLLLDEVSASVDRETEKRMQDIIRTEFRDYTVIAVSHRLNMIMDFDRVVVLDGGEIVEVGNPAELAGRPDTWFWELCAFGGK